jgi:hypothetical protein
MNGSVTMQFLYQAYQTNMVGVVTNYATAILGAVAATVQGAVMLYIIILGHKMMFNALSWDAGATKMVRLIIVAAIMTAANYQTFVATPVTTTIPNWIANTVTGTQGLQGAQGFDALINQIQHFSAVARAQMIGIPYIGDRAVVWVFGAMAEIIVLLCFCIWALAAVTADFLVPLGAIVIPFYLFDATRDLCARWFGKIIALFLVMILALMLGQVVVFQDAQYMQRFMAAVAAAPPGAGFDMNPDLENPGAFTAATPGGQAGATINDDSAIDTLGDALLVDLFGLFLMSILVGVGLGIGGSSGFSVAPALNAVTRVGKTVISRR